MKEQDGQVNSPTVISILRSSAKAADDSATTVNADDNSQNFRMKGVM